MESHGASNEPLYGHSLPISIYVVYTSRVRQTHNENVQVTRAVAYANKILMQSQMRGKYDCVVQGDVNSTKQVLVLPLVLSVLFFNNAEDNTKVILKITSINSLCN